jgi:hypothetical protein
MNQELIKAEASRIMGQIREILESDLDMPIDAIDWKQKRKRLAMYVIGEIIKSGNGDIDDLIEVRNKIRES